MSAKQIFQLSDSQVRAFWEPKLQEIGRSIDIDLNFGTSSPHDTLIKLWNRRLQRSADSIALETLGQSLSFRQVDEASNALATYLLTESGLQSGDVVAILMPNISQYVVSVLAIMKAGMIVTNVNPLYTEREIKHQLNHSKAQLVICLANTASNLARVVQETAVKKVIETDLFDLEAPLKRALKNTLVRYVKKMVPAHSYPKSVTHVRFPRALTLGWHSWRKDPKAWAEKLRNISELCDCKKPAFYQYTGGTTGGSKGAMLSHWGMTTNVVSAYYSGLMTLRYRDLEVLNDGAHGWIALPLPLYHIYSLHCFFLFTVATGLAVSLIPNPRDLESFMKTLKSRTFDVMPGIQTLFVALMSRPDFEEAHFERTYTLSAGMGLAAEVYRQWEKRVGKAIIEGFGLTEASPVATFNPYDRPMPSSCGLPIGGTLMKLRDSQSGDDLPLGDPTAVGEIFIKGPQVMLGYLDNPSETKAMITDDGWMRTGDLGVIDAKGYIHIVGRIKEMIIVSGFNVYPDEIESVALETHLVAEVAAVGVPDSHSGEKVVVYCVPSGLAAGEFSLEQLLRLKEQLQEAFHKNLTNYKRPHAIHFCRSLPKSPIGKILRRLVRDRALETARSGETKVPVIEPAF